MSDNYRQSIQKSFDYLKSKGIGQADVGIVLGTGLTQFINEISIEKEIPYNEIPGFLEATVEFHAGKLVYGTIGKLKVIAMKGRYHYYEGYSMQQLTLPIRVMKLLGIQHLFLSNAAGAMNLNWKKGDLMLIRDHINLQPSNPLIGKNLDDFGPRFPDMSNAYDANWRSNIKEFAIEENIDLKEGVYVSVPGPMLESPAEYRYLNRIGADAVGMSTVPEVIVAIHSGIKVAAISVLTDECDPYNLQPVNIEEIIEVAGKSEKKLNQLLKKVILSLK